jgi:hypothetical protein
MLYLAGYASGAVQSGLNSIVSNGPDQMFAALNLTASTLMWTQFVGGIGGSDAAMGLAIHPTTGVVYASGFIGAAVASSVTRAQGTFYGNVDLTLSTFNQTNGSLLWTIVAGTSSLDQGFGISFNTNGVLFMATRWNSSDGYLVFNLDATGNNSFPAPNTTAGAFQLNICYSSPWISTSTRTVFTTLTETMTPALVTQINSQTVFSTVTSTVVQSTTITQTSVIIQPALVTPTTITDCSNSNTGSRNENISGGLSADGNVLIILVIVVIILVVIIGVITSFSFSRVRRSMHELKKDNNGANNSFGFGYIRARNSSIFGNATTGLMTSIKEQNIMDENNTMQKMEQSAGVQRYLETSPGIF